MTEPRLNLVDGTLALLTAAVAGGNELEALLGASVATMGWFGTGAISDLQGECGRRVTDRTRLALPLAAVSSGFAASRRGGRQKYEWNDPCPTSPHGSAF